MAHVDPRYMNGLTYDGQELRDTHSASVQHGVVGAGQLKVSRNGTSSHSILVTAGQGYVPSNEGLYRCRTDSTEASNTFETGEIAPPPGGSINRIDRLVLRVYDPAHEVTSLKKSRFEIVSGASLQATGLTLDSEANKPAVPQRSLLLADLLVRGGSTFFATTDIRDRRPWCRGAFSRTIMTAHTAGSPLPTTLTEIPETRKRIECTGLPVRMRFLARLRGDYTSNEEMHVHLFPLVDGVAIDGFSSAVPTAIAYIISFPNNAPYSSFDVVQPEWTTIPTAGSHVFSWGVVKTTAPGSAYLDIAGGNPYPPALVQYEELIRQNTSND